MKISVITTTFNDCENLLKIIDTVKSQDYSDIEHIIIDGGSTDGTLEVIKEYQKQFPETVSFISEKDHGIYDAINKGIRMAKGDLIGCCFDQYATNDVLSKMVSIIEKENTDGVHGDLCYVKDGKVVRFWKQGQGIIQNGWLPAHPTLYLKKSVYDQYGLYKTDYKISADYEYMVRILKDGQVKLSYIDQVLIYMAYGGTSSNGFSAYYRSWKEGHRALKENHVKHPWVIDAKRIMRVLMQFFSNPKKK